MKIKSALFTLALAAGFTTAIAQDVYSTWASSRTVSIKTTGLGLVSTTRNFPLLVRVNSTHADVFTTSKGKGADIRFVRGNMTTRLPHQVERWDSAGRMAEIWVLVDSVPAGGTTDIKMLYNKVGAADSSSPRGRAVFDTSNGFVSVWHLGDSTAANPRPNQIKGAPTAILKNFGMPTVEDPTPVAYTPKAGIIAFADSLRGGAGDELSGTKDFIDLNRRGYQGFSDFNTGFTFSLWVYSNGPLFAERFVEMLDDTTSSASSDTRIILFGNRTDPVPNGLSVRWGSGGVYNSPTELYQGNVWTHITYAKAGGSAPMNLYVNGVLGGTTDPLPDLAVGLRNYVYLGRSSVTASDPYFQGKFDEVQISKVGRSADWAKLTFAIQKPGISVLDTNALVGDTGTISISGNRSFASKGAFSVRSAGSEMRFFLPSAKAGKLSVVDVWGRTVWSRNIPAGVTAVSWNGKAASGFAARGVYVARFIPAGSSAALERKFTFNP
jgi:hypothetical protein